jgi:outer membrane protein OmpA-like peptidoglycan-associated protein
MDNAMKAIKATLVSVMLALSTGCATHNSIDGEPSFPNVESAWLKEGAFVDVEQLRRIGPGMTKNQVRELISYPHFKEFISEREWDYIFNFRTGVGNEFATCQYKIVFHDGLSDRFYWKGKNCESYVYPKSDRAEVYEKINLNADVLFQFDKSGLGDLLPEGKVQLEKIANDIRRRYDVLHSVVIWGHTDRLGSTEYNRALASSRAESVKGYFVTKGVPDKIIDTKPVGDLNPVVNCSDALPREELINCLQPNRRVEIEVRGQGVAIKQ